MQTIGEVLPCTLASDISTSNRLLVLDLRQQSLPDLSAADPKTTYIVTTKQYSVLSQLITLGFFNILVVESPLSVTQPLLETFLRTDYATNKSDLASGLIEAYRAEYKDSLCVAAAILDAINNNDFESFSKAASINLEVTASSLKLLSSLDFESLARDVSQMQTAQAELSNMHNELIAIGLAKADLEKKLSSTFSQEKKLIAANAKIKELETCIAEQLTSSTTDVDRYLARISELEEQIITLNAADITSDLNKRITELTNELNTYKSAEQANENSTNIYLRKVTELQEIINTERTSHSIELASLQESYQKIEHDYEQKLSGIEKQLEDALALVATKESEAASLRTKVQELSSEDSVRTTTLFTSQEEELVATKNTLREKEAALLDATTRLSKKESELLEVIEEKNAEISILAQTKDAELTEAIQAKSEEFEAAIQAKDIESQNRIATCEAESAKKIASLQEKLGAATSFDVVSSTTYYRERLEEISNLTAQLDTFRRELNISTETDLSNKDDVIAELQKSLRTATSTPYSVQANEKLPVITNSTLLNAEKILYLKEIRPAIYINSLVTWMNLFLQVQYTNNFKNQRTFLIVILDNMFNHYDLAKYRKRKFAINTQPAPKAPQIVVTDQLNFDTLKGTLHIDSYDLLVIVDRLHLQRSFVDSKKSYMYALVNTANDSIDFKLDPNNCIGFFTPDSTTQYTELPKYLIKPDGDRLGIKDYTMRAYKIMLDGVFPAIFKEMGL